MTATLSFKFPMGVLVLTNGVSAKCTDNEDFSRFVSDSIKRHGSGDWGEVSEHDRQANDDAFIKGQEDRVLSSYTYKDGTRIWLLTEWNRSITTVLFPDEY